MSGVALSDRQTDIQTHNKNTLTNGCIATSFLLTEDIIIAI